LRAQGYEYVTEMHGAKLFARAPDWVISTGVLVKMNPSARAILRRVIEA
jgi:hypothetical protein